MNTIAWTRGLMAVGVGGMAFFAPSAVAIPVDIVFIVDHSGSMANDIAQVKARIVDFDGAMVANDIDAQYALVTFGSFVEFRQQPPFLIDNGPGPALRHDRSDFSSFSQSLNAITTQSTINFETGIDAIILALENVQFRANSVRNTILITDEDDDSLPSQRNDADALLSSSNALFNFIGTPGPGGSNNTDSTYGFLAANHGGTAFRIDAFRAEPGPFFDRFIDTKVQEILATVPVTVPEPITAVLGAMSLTAWWAALRPRVRAG